MNRKIKFRVWSNNKNCWLHSIAIGENGIPLVVYVEIDDERKIINKVYTIDNLEPSIQQFTGFKDKNGTEIYEGDVLFEDDGRHNLIVEQQPSALWCADSKKGYIDYVLNICSKCIVIGNIMESIK